jgi:hypothetical protein
MRVFTLLLNMAEVKAVTSISQHSQEGQEFSTIVRDVSSLFLLDCSKEADTT